MKALPSKQLTFKLFEKDMTVDYPNTRGLINISILKAQISKQQYDAISSSNNASDTYVLFLIDAIATLSVIAPELEKTLNAKSFYELDTVDASKILKVYLKTILPWMNEWQNVFTSDPDEVVGEEKK